VSRAEAGQLLSRYFHGDLSSAEQEQLKDAFLSDQDLFNAFAEEAILTELLGDVGFRAKVNSAVQPQPKGVARLARSLQSLPAGWRWAGAAAMAASVLLVAVVLYRGSPHPNETPSASAAAHEPTPAVLTVLLVPTERNAGAPKIMIGDYRTVRLRMNVPEGNFATYRALLKAADGPFHREFGGLLPDGGPSGERQLELEFPASLLPAGDYTLEVFGVTSAGAEPVAGYGFSVARKK
jgi:hypothetical protein